MFNKKGSPELVNSRLPQQTKKTQKLIMEIELCRSSYSGAGAVDYLSSLCTEADVMRI